MAARNAPRPLDQTDDTPQASPSAPDPLPKLRPRLRKIQLRIVLFTVLFEPFLLLIKGRRRRRWREFLGSASPLLTSWPAWLDDPELARRMGQRAADLVAS
jgi:hypothetical protein